MKSTGIVESANLFSAHASFFLRIPRMRQKYLFLFRECGKILLAHTEVMSIFGLVSAMSSPNTPKRIHGLLKNVKVLENAPNVFCRILMLPQRHKMEIVSKKSRKKSKTF